MGQLRIAMPEPSMNGNMARLSIRVYMSSCTHLQPVCVGLEGFRRQWERQWQLPVQLILQREQAER